MAAAENAGIIYDKLFSALSSTKRIQRHLDMIVDKDSYVIKDLPYKNLISLREDCIKHYRARTIFNYKLKYSLKGTEKQFVKLKDQKAYLTVTNLPELQYLDLPVYGVNLEQHYESVRQVPEVYMEEQIRNHYLVDSSSSGNAFNYLQLETLFDSLLTAFLAHVREILEEEYKQNEMLSILKCWDAKRFEKILNFCIRKPEHIKAYVDFYMFISMLEKNTTDSELIAESFRKMCTYFHHRNFSSYLPDYCIQFMLKHLKLSAKGPEPFGQHNNWLMSEHLVAKKFFRADKTSLKLLLRYNCPTIFHPSYSRDFFPPDYLPSAEYWPRKSDGATSYNSPKYYMYITCLIISLLYESPVQREDLTDCIQLLWMSLPTPIIPIVDMQEFLLIMSQNFGWNETFGHLKVFPSEHNDTVYQPRSLLHLSRYTIVQSCHFPEEISSLHLPTKLKWYLKLNSLESFSKEEYDRQVF